AWRDPAQLWLALPMGLTLAHLLLGEVGGYRYEAYLVGLTLLGLALSWQADPPVLPRHPFGVVLLLLAVFPLGVRAGFFYQNYPRSVRNIYQQPVQVARFLHSYYPDAPVAVNDIGLVSFWGDAPVTDLVGVGDQMVQRARRSGQFGPEEVAELARQRGFPLVVGHPHWIGGWLPDDWVPVANWTIPDNFICAGPTVTWYATRPGAADTLRRHLLDYLPLLPAGVRHEALIPPAGSGH
ncbi:MAG: hypothetical protein D6722_20290, partial [Bacteroidetes bacterium]